MLRNKEIIEKLNREQKILLLTTLRLPEGLPNMPSFCVANIDEIGKNDYAPLLATANSWDEILISNLAAELAAIAAFDGVNAIITPDLGLKGKADTPAAIQDSYLNGIFAMALCNGISRAGCRPILSNCQASDLGVFGELANASIVCTYTSNADFTKLDEKTLDELTDKLLDFVSSCPRTANAPVRPSKAYTLAAASFEQSIVLLKNKDNILPLGSSFVMPINAISEGLVEVGEDIIIVFWDNNDSDKDDSSKKESIDRLVKQGKRIIAIIPTGFPLTAPFDRQCSAVIAAPLCGAHSIFALEKIIRGEINPSAKLSYAIFDAELGRKLPQYPFGHGLCFASFEYHNLQVSGNGVCFEVRNDGPYDGVETVQVYTSEGDFGSIPQIIAFKKLFIRVGESKVVNIEFNQDTIIRLDGKNIFVGASSADIRLNTTFVRKDKTTEITASSSEQFVSPQSNIVSGKYIMSKNRKKRVPWLQIIAICLIVAACIYDIISIAFALVRTPSIVLLASTNALAALAVIYLIIAASRRKMRRLNSWDSDSVGRENEVLLSGRTELEELFLEEFSPKTNEKRYDYGQNTDNNGNDNGKRYDYGQSMDNTGNDKALDDVSLQDISNGRLDNVTYQSVNTEQFVLEQSQQNSINSHITIRDEFAAFVDYLRGQGVGMGMAQAYSLFTGIICSNSIVLRSSETQLLDKLADSLCAVCGSQTFTNSIINLAMQNKENVFFAVYQKDIVVPSQTLPNLLRVFPISKNDALDCIAKEVLEQSLIIDLKLSQLKDDYKGEIWKQTTLPQLVMYARQAEKEYLLSENMWKRLDIIVDFIEAHSSYKISNKEWRAMEKFTSVYLALGGEEKDALDSVIAARLLYKTIPLIEVQDEDNSIMQLLERALGEENIVQSLEAIKYFRTTREG